MQQCHLCSFAHCQPSGQSSQTSLSPSQQYSSSQGIPKCCIKRCNKKYCINCIRDKFDSAFQQSNYRADTWICYSCQNLCGCMICKGIGSDKKGNKKKNNGNNNTGQNNKLESKADLQKQPVLEDYYNNQQIDKAAPFYRRILQRRNHLFKLMATAPSSPQQPTEPVIKPLKDTVSSEKQQEHIKLQQKSLAIKQLISKTLKDYGDDDSNDIQLLD